MAVKCRYILPKVVVPKILTAGTGPAYIKAVGLGHVTAGLCASPKCVRAKWLLDNNLVKKHPVSGRLVPHYW